MYLISLKESDKYSGPHKRGNPYSSQVRKNEILERIIDKFIGMTQPLFLGENVIPRGDEQTVTLQPQKLTHMEWELNQDCFTLLINDLLYYVGLFISFMANRFTDDLVVFLDIYFNIEEDLNACKEKTHSSAHTRATTHESLKIGLHLDNMNNTAQWFTQCVALGQDRTDPSPYYEKAKQPVPPSFNSTWHLNPGNIRIIIYRIRGPAFIKNLLILLSNIRN
jgi:hypothetical protein